MGAALKLVARFAPGLLGGPTMYLIIGIALVAGVLMARMHWIQVGREDIIRENAAKVVKIVRQVEVLKETVRVPYVKRETVIETRYEEIEKEAANVPSRPACNVTVGWMREHDNAAAPDRSEPGAVDDPSDSGIGEASAAAVIARNYKRYWQVANDLKACRGFVGGLTDATR